MVATPSDIEPYGIAAQRDVSERGAVTDTAVYTAGVYGAQILLFLAGIIQKRLLGPTGTGYWTLVATLYSYVAFASLGVFHGGTRQIPFARGRGDFRAAAEYADTTATFSVIAIGVAACCVAVVALAFGSGWAPQLRWGLVFLGLVAPLNALTDVHELMLQVTRRFSVLAFGGLLKAAMTLVVTSALVVAFGFYGMLVGWIMMLVAVLALWVHLGITGVRKPAFRPRVDRRCVVKLARVGLPIQTYAQLWVLFVSVDNVIVARFQDVHSLGFYALAVSITSYVLLLPNSIATALFPRMQEEFGAQGQTRALSDYVTNVQTLLAGLLVPLVIGAGYFLVPALIRAVLPAFRPAVPVVHIMVAGSFCIAMVNMPIELLLTTGRRWLAAGIMLACLTVNAVANYVVVALFGWGIKGAAGATAFSYLLVFLLTTVAALRGTRGGWEQARHIARLAVAGSWTIGAAWAAELVLGTGSNTASDVGLACTKLALFVVLISPLLFFVQRRYAALSVAGRAIRRAAARRR